MKNLKKLGNILTKEEMKNIMGSYPPCTFRAPDGTYTGVCVGGWCVANGIEHRGSECLPKPDAS